LIHWSNYFSKEKKMEKLQIEIREAKNLKDRYIFGSVEVFVEMKIEKITQVTKIDFELNPKFYQKFYTNSSEIKENDKIEIKVYDGNIIFNQRTKKKKLG
jgi:hypothetical protein